MNVTIVSPFRDSSAGINAYIERIEKLELPGGHIRVVCVEGDSKDDTLATLNMWALVAPWVKVVKCDTGKPRYGSVVNPERFAVLATVFNAGLDAVDLDWSDWVLFVPSDIKYEPDLITRLMAWDKDVIAAFPFQDKVFFYDTWAFQRCGRGFGNFPFEALANLGDKPIEMDTVGGTLLIDADVLRTGVRYRTEDVDRGFCIMAREHGFRVWADPTTIVVH